MTGFNKDAAEAALRALKARKASAGTFGVYKPSPTQRACLDDMATYRLLEGPNRSGKSYHGRFECAGAVTGRHPTRPNVEHSNFLLLVYDRDKAYDPWMPYLLGQGTGPNGLGKEGAIPHDMIAVHRNRPAIAWDHNGTKTIPRMVKLTNGNTLFIGLHGQSGRWKREAGRAYAAIFIDEPGEDMEEMFGELEPRLWEARTAHPHSGYMLWTATDVVVNELLEEWRHRGESPDWPAYSRYVIHPGENAAVSAEVREQAAAALGEEAAAIRVHGTAGAMDSLRIYPQFTKESHVLTGPYEWNDDDNIVFSYDPGIKDATGIDVAVMSRHNPRKFTFVKSIRLKGGDVKAEARALISWLDGRRLAWGTYDKNGATKRDRTGNKVIDQFMGFLSDPELWMEGTPCLVKYKGQIDAGVRRVISYLDPDPAMSWEPLIAVDKPTEENGLAAFINEMAAYRLKRREDVGKPFKHDIINIKRNEGPDNCRYLVTSSQQWRDLGPNVPTGYVHPLAVAVPPASPQEEALLSEEQRLAQQREQRSREIAERAARRCKKKRPNWRTRIGGMFS